MTKSKKANADVTVTDNGDAVYTPTDAQLDAGIDASMPDGGRPMVGSEFASSGHARQGKPQETKAQRFRRLAEARVQKALDRIMQLVPLGNRSQYEYGPQEADCIVGALSEAVARVKAAFNGAPNERPTFRLH